MIRLILSITLPLTCFYALANTQCKTIDQIAWIVGDWQQVSNSTIEGLGFTLDQNEKVVFQESLRIVEMQDQLFFLAKVDGNDLPVAFKATKCTTHSILFENTKHDFPQRLLYTHSQSGLTVDVSNKQGKGFTLVFTQVQGWNR